jgi:hypothetical protein
MVRHTCVSARQSSDLVFHLGNFERDRTADTTVATATKEFS